VIASRRPWVYITQPVAQRAIERLRAITNVAWNPDPLHVVTKPELLEAIRRCDYLFCLLHDRVDADVIAANPGLRMIASMAITPADIDVAAATARKIPVTVIPPMVTEATADLTWALLLAVARRLAEADRLVRAGTFPGAQSPYLEGRTVSGATLGLVGMGRIGQAVARRARGFAMRLLYYDPQRLPAADEAALGLSLVPLDELLPAADFVSLHPRLSPQTHHLIGEKELRRMKRTAYLINTSRSPVVDERALAKALEAGWIAGAGLDVYEGEPQPAPELLRLSNVVLTPHMGSAVATLREAMAMIVVDNIQAGVEGRRPPNCVNPEIYE
jgi:glyoxylate reductase